MAINVLIVDDSAVVRKILSDILNSATGINVQGAVQDPIFAMGRIEKNRPDVILLDVEMPRMDGLTFLRQIMEKDPIPVVMCSGLTEKSSRVGIEALSIGAVDVIGKPKMDLKKSLGDAEKEIINAVRSAAKANLSSYKIKRPLISPVIAPKLTADAILESRSGNILSTQNVVAIGTSTGGTHALEEILTSLSPSCVGIVVVQHMPKAFTAAFAQRLNGLSQVEVKEGEDGDEVRPGRVIIAPGGVHMMVETKNMGLPFIRLKDGPLVSRHKPSVDVLFRSVAKSVGKKALGIIMTGMGDDGAAGLKEMRDAGAQTLAQDEATCVVYGMPAVAVQKGAVDKEVPLDKISQIIEEYSAKVR